MPRLNYRRSLSLAFPDMTLRPTSDISLPRMCHQRSYESFTLTLLEW